MVNQMSNVAFFKARYLTSKTGKGFAKEINSTHKWAEHMLSRWEIKNILDNDDTLTYDERVVLRKADAVAERKCLWHFKRDDFNLNIASFLLETAKRAMPE